MNPVPLLSGFQFQTLLLETATACIWRAFQEKLERPVLIISFKDTVELDTDYRRQVFETIQTLSNLKISLFPDVIDIIRQHDQFFIILEDAASANILTLLKGQRLNATQLTQIAMQLAEGFASLQARGLVFGAFSPYLLYITEESTPLLPAITFVRNATAAPLTLHHPELSARDYLWLAPEQCCDEPLAIDTRADIFAVGLTLYALATGQLPFGRLPPEALPTAKLTQSVPSPCDISPNFPPALAAVLVKMTQRDPADRYADWDEVRFDLYHALRGVVPNGVKAEDSVIAPPHKPQKAQAGNTIRLSVQALRKYRTARKQHKGAATVLRFMSIGLIILILIAFSLFIKVYFL